MNAQVLPDRIDALWLDCNVATMAADAPYGAIEQAAIAVAGDCIAWVGPETQLPAHAAEQSKSVHHLRGAWVTPGLVDCHTHLVYAGNRAHEFEMRLSGAAYEEIARAGGGIMSTVKSVRTATFEALYLASAARLEAMQRQGVTTVEIKSGYGLDPPNERKMLGVIRRLGQDFSVTVRSTFLGAHALPPEYKTCPDAYVEVVTREMLPAFKADNLVDAVDVFCEHIAFTPAQTERIFQAATDIGLRVKLHADQLSDQGGAALAARYNALSADHLEYVSQAGIAALAKADTVAVILPGAFYFLREPRKPPIDLFRQAGVPMAVSTDCNPGSSPTTSPLLMMNMACVLFSITPEEALAGVTIHAAKALGLDTQLGTIEVDKKADFAIWDISTPAELACNMGGSACRCVVKNGAIVFHDSDSKA